MRLSPGNAKLALRKLINRVGYDFHRWEPDAFERQRQLISTIPTPVIFDVGANTGDLTAGYLSFFPEAQVYCFEPTPSTFARLKQRFVDDSRVHPYPLAIANQIQTAQFHLNRNDQTNSLLPTSDLDLAPSAYTDYMSLEQVIEIQCTTLDQMRETHQLDQIALLKLDVQGGELSALQGAELTLRKGAIAVIYVEVEFVQLYQDQPLFHDISSFLHQFGYQLLNLYNSVHHQGQLICADAIFLSPTFIRPIATSK